jgi:hypothetical protein
MCIVFGEGKRLPEDQHELFNRVVDAVLHSRYRNTPTRIPVIRGRLAVVAHGMHTGAGIGETRATPQAEATFDEVERMIRAYQEKSAATEEGFTGALAAREELLSGSGLLVQRGDERAAFYHLSLQDFFAAGRLLGLSRGQLDAVFRGRGDRPEWRGALAFLFGALLASNELPDEAVDLLSGLVQSVDEQAVSLQIVLGRCLEILIRRRLRLHAGIEDRFRQLCVSAIDREVDLRDRLQLALALGRIGDPRIIQDLRDRAAYVEVPPGIYRVGEKDETRSIRLEEPLWLLRHPVTNSQYGLFIDEGGYKNLARWWSPGGQAWARRERVQRPLYWQHARFGAPNQPVVGVSFWEAEAFASWTGGRLPTGDESEAAARGPDGHEYPWGNEWHDGICNTFESRLGQTSPVGMFPASRSRPFGLDDMAGNVWEWCADEPREGVRVVRGGSWGGSARIARSAFRFRDLPVIRVGDLGFRVVVVGVARTR